MVHLAERLAPPPPLTARPYAGPADHSAMASILTAYRTHHGDPEAVTAEQIDISYAHLVDCDPDDDIAVLEDGDDPIGYVRASFEDLGTGVRDCVLFSPLRPDRIDRQLFDALVAAQEAHMQPWADGVDRARFRAYASHPGPERLPVGEAAWLEEHGYRPTEWGATLLRPHLDDIPDRRLPDGVEVRSVEPDQIRTILEAHFEAFRGEWDFREPVEADFAEAIEDPLRDESLWKVAWAGDTVVGQVKPFVNAEENRERGTQRGYTEQISTHRDWRNRGICSALLAMSLRELEERGMTEAAMGVDTNNPGGALHVYTRLGFEIRGFEAVYTRPAHGREGSASG